MIPSDVQNGEQWTVLTNYQARKVDRKVYVAEVIYDGWVWVCSHSHYTPRQAEGCAEHKASRIMQAEAQARIERIGANGLVRHE